MWAEGNLLGSYALIILNFYGPCIPLNALNPSRGILEVPVTNCKKAAI